MGEMGRGQSTQNASRPMVTRWQGQRIRHPSRNGGARGDGASPPRRRADGEQGSEDLPAQSRLRTMGLSEGCPGCRHLRTGQGRQQAHSEACRRRMEGLLKGDPAGSARLAAADERINLALADAVERHVTKNPGVRGILKRASARHPESKSQKRIALDTAGCDTTPSCLTRGIIGVRCTTQRHHEHRPGHRHERRSSTTQ